MDLSILDQSPVLGAVNDHEALWESLKLAQLGERLGYKRYWATEHHGIQGLACSAPEVLLTFIGAHTNTIRLGAGAVLLPHYKPYKIAEVYQMLATLYPDRIDMGLGRAPGGSAEVTNALSDNFLKNVYEFPKAVQTLLHLLKQDFSSDELFSKITVRPKPETPPIPWLLGTSKKSAELAAKLGLPYAFGQFMSDADAQIIMDHYKSLFTAGIIINPQSICTVNVICCETFEAADDIMWQMGLRQIYHSRGEAVFPTVAEARSYSYNLQEEEQIKAFRQKTIYGDPDTVALALKEASVKSNVDEWMINTPLPDYEQRRYSYELIATRLLLD